MSETHTHGASAPAVEQGGCSCGCGTSSAEAASATGGVTTTFQVVGMTCGHCIGAVTDELTGTIGGVKDVQIDLPSGRVIVTSDQPVTEAAIAAAVDEAGYQLAPGSLH